MAGVDMIVGIAMGPFQTVVAITTTEIAVATGTEVAVTETGVDIGTIVVAAAVVGAIKVDSTIALEVCLF